MITFLNGKFVFDDQAMVSVSDRGFLYGDGLFETIRVTNGRPIRWNQHMERLQHGAGLLRLSIPYSVDALREFADELIRKNETPEAVLRLTVTRGIGPRGYSIKQGGRPTVVMNIHPAPVIDPGKPPRWRLATAPVPVQGGDPLAALKSCNKLPQILARAEAEAQGAEEALMLNADGFVAEGASSNIFWIEKEIVCTPPLTDGVLPGVTRAAVLEVCWKLGVSTRERSIRPEVLRAADGVFLTLSTFGIVEVTALDGQELALSPLVAKLREGYACLAD